MILEKIHNKIFEFVRDKGICPDKIFMTHSDYCELKNEVEFKCLLSNFIQDEGLKVCGLEINATYDEVGMHVINNIEELKYETRKETQTSKTKT